MRICVRQFRTAEDGATAVEFAMIAPIFLALIFTILQYGLVFFAEKTLQSAADTASRKIMTGQAQSASMTQSDFKNIVCPLISALFDCTKVYVDVQKYSSFSGSNYTAPTLTYDAQGNVSNVWTYNAGAAGDIVIVRLIYRWQVAGGPLAMGVTNLTGGYRLMMGMTAFRNEPF
jgi:Flp pilus assembly protein TadG